MTMKIVDKLGCRALLCKIFETMKSIGNAVRAELEIESLPFSESSGPHSQHVKLYFNELYTIYCAKHRFPHPDDEKDAVEPLLEAMRRLFRSLHTEVATVIDHAQRQTPEEADRLLQQAIQACDKIAEEAAQLYDEALKILSQEGNDPVVTGPREAMRKTVVSVDMSQYGRQSSHAEDLAGVEGLFILNEQILEIMRCAIRKVGVDPNSVILIETGDGALLLFDDSKVAIQFAEEVHRAADITNREILHDENKRHFRIGISAGQVMLQPVGTRSKSLVKYHLAGVAIAVAVRLQSGANTGEILATEAALRLIPDNLASAFSETRQVQAKKHEQPITAKVWTVCVPAPWDHTNPALFTKPR